MCDKIISTWSKWCELTDSTYCVVKSDVVLIWQALALSHFLSKILNFVLLATSAATWHLSLATHQYQIPNIHGNNSAKFHCLSIYVLWAKCKNIWKNGLIFTIVPTSLLPQKVGKWIQIAMKFCDHNQKYITLYFGKFQH